MKAARKNPRPVPLTAQPASLPADAPRRLLSAFGAWLCQSSTLSGLIMVGIGVAGTKLGWLKNDDAQMCLGSGLTLLLQDNPALLRVGQSLLVPLTLLLSRGNKGPGSLPPVSPSPLPSQAPSTDRTKP